MRFGFLFVALLVACTDPAPPAPVAPQVPEAPVERLRYEPPGLEAARVIEAVEVCLHWSGEEPYDAERAKQIEASLKRDCDRALKIARENVTAASANASASRALVQLAYAFQAGDEPYLAGILSADNREAVCRKAGQEIARRKQGPHDPDDFIAYDQVCAR